MGFLRVIYSYIVFVIYFFIMCQLFACHLFQSYMSSIPALCHLMILIKRRLFGTFWPHIFFWFNKPSSILVSSILMLPQNVSPVFWLPSVVFSSMSSIFLILQSVIYPLYIYMIKESVSILLLWILKCHPRSSACVWTGVYTINIFYFTSKCFKSYWHVSFDHELRGLVLLANVLNRIDMSLLIMNLEVWIY